MRKLFAFVFMFVIILAVVSAATNDFGYNNIERPTLSSASVNYSLVNVNNSQFLQGYSPATLRDWMQTTYDGLYCKLTGCTMTGDIDMDGHDLTFGGSGSSFNTSLLIDGDTAGGNATLKINSEINQYSCIELTEGAGAIGFRICNDGAGTNRLVFSNNDDGNEWMWIDRDNGDIEIPNDNQKFLFGAGQDASIYYDGTDMIIDPKEVGSGSLKVNGSLNVTDNLEVGGNITGNQIYGGMYYHNHTATDLNFVVQDTWYPLYFTDADKLNGFTYVGGFGLSSNLTAQVSGTYQANYMGIGSGQNNHVYLTTILINGVDQEKCGSHHKMATGGDVITQGSTCFIDISVGNTVSVATQDMGGTGTGKYYGGNLNLVRVGS